MNSVHTLGHSTRSADEFVAILRAYGITLVADVRRFPGSRRHPQFGAEALADLLRENGFAYRHLEALGGRRSGSPPDSPNAGWVNRAFRAYADYALTEAFQAQLDELIGLAASDVPVIVCSEAVFWRCHRRIIADWLLVRGCDVVDIYDARRADAHQLPAFANVSAGRLTYPGSGGNAPG